MKERKGEKLSGKREEGGKEKDLYEPIAKIYSQPFCGT